MSISIFLKGWYVKTTRPLVYFRTDDEWTGFSTIALGYRFAPAEYFNFAIEGGVGFHISIKQISSYTFKISDSQQFLLVV